MRSSVLRCVWLAAVALSATGATGCRGDAGPPQVAPGTPVGKVVDVAGQVTATRDGKTRVLGPGEDVSPDDVVATADTGSVSIELFHNRANLQLQNGASSRIDDSLAWELTTSDVAKLPGGKVMVSAGRHGEHSAAATANNVQRTQPAAGSATAPESPPPPPVVASGAGLGIADKVDKKRAEPADEQKAGTATGGAEREPITKDIAPPKPDLPRKGPTSQPSPGGDALESAGDVANRPDSPRPKQDVPITDEETRNRAPKDKVDSSLLATRIEAVRAKLKRCLAGDVKHLTIIVTVAAGKLTFRFAEPGADSARTCVQGVLKEVDVKSADGSTSIELSL